MKKLSVLYGLALLGMVTSVASATNLVIFQTNDVVANAAIADTTAEVLDPSVTVSSLALNFPNVSPLGSAWASALSVGNVNATSAANNTLASAITGDGVNDSNGTDGGDYVTVTVTPLAPINFTEIVLNIAHNWVGTSPLGSTFSPANIDLLSSLTGFTAADSLGTFNPPNPGSFANHTGTFNLSGVPALQGVTVPVEFRFYFSNVTNRMSIGHVFNGNAVTDDVIIRGEVVAVPEPASILLLCSSVACLVLRRHS